MCCRAPVRVLECVFLLVCMSMSVYVLECLSVVLRYTVLRFLLLHEFVLVYIFMNACLSMLLNG